MTVGDGEHLRAKIMRRVIRATHLGKEPGDLSSLDNPGGVKAIAEVV